MNAAAAVSLPSGRIVAGWQRDLSRLEPRALWVLHLLVHRVEAPVVGRSLLPLDCLQQGLLRYLPASPEAGTSLRELAAPLHLDEQLLHRVLLSLESLGLARNSSSSESGRRWARTERGTQTLEEGGVREERRARRVFHFTVATPDADTARFLPLEVPPLTPPGEPWPFRLEWLTASFQQPAEWKKRWSFPADATAL